MALRGDMPGPEAARYVAVQILGGISGTALAHAMFGLPLFDVGLYIIAVYWFTASTSFANPAVAIARSLTSSPVSGLSIFPASSQASWLAL